MTAGIYQLTFKNNQTYVGKSVDVKQRWQQHSDKLARGTAAQNMQRAGTQFSAELLLEVHPDLLDEYENYYIHQLKPELNAQIPQPRTDYKVLETWSKLGYQVYPTTWAFELVIELCAVVEALQVQVNSLTAEQETWSSSAYEKLCMDEHFAEVRASGNRYLVKYNELKHYKQRVEACGWWDRLWKAWNI